jgi:hypothetical protein
MQWNINKFLWFKILKGCFDYSRQPFFLSKKHLK